MTRISEYEPKACISTILIPTEGENWNLNTWLTKLHLTDPPLYATALRVVNLTEEAQQHHLIIIISASKTEASKFHAGAYTYSTQAQAIARAKKRKAVTGARDTVIDRYSSDYVKTHLPNLATDAFLTEVIFTITPEKILHNTSRTMTMFTETFKRYLSKAMSLRVRT